MIVNIFIKAFLWSIFNCAGILLLIMIFTSGAFSQDLLLLEKKYSEQTIYLVKQKQNLDSLQAVLTDRVNLIDSEKKKTKPNNDKIVDLMSKSATLTNQINTLQVKLKKEENELEETKKQLSNYYSKLIDSLKAIQRSAGASKSNELSAQILFLTEKKLLVSPRVSNLSFNPEHIMKIDLNSIYDPTERKIYYEYLESALDEVDEQISQVTIRSAELKQIAQLKKKVERFVEETDFEGNVRFFNYRSSSDRGELGTFTPLDGTETDNILLSQFASYSNLLNQLDIPGYINIQSKPGNMKNFKLSLNEYSSLLKEIKNYLQEYRLVLLNKLQTAR